MRVTVVVVVQVLIGVQVFSLVLDEVLEEGQILTLNLSQRCRLLLGSVVVGVEIGNLYTELVLVGIGNLDVVFVGKQVPVIALEGAEAERLTTLRQVCVLVRILGLGASQVLVCVGVLVLAGGDRGIVLLLPLVRVVEVWLRRNVRVVVLVCVGVGVVVVVVLPRVVLGPLVRVLGVLEAGGPITLSAHKA